MRERPRRNSFNDSGQNWFCAISAMVLRLSSLTRRIDAGKRLGKFAHIAQGVISPPEAASNTASG
jgi:hypothetical protein